ncbi:MAG: hypothetical protein KJ574_04010, partial [Nanoarchaeota archaeon]|nr:hypothetical protein [Nanoarchaeota archaeon]
MNENQPIPGQSNQQPQQPQQPAQQYRQPYPQQYPRYQTPQSYQQYQQQLYSRYPQYAPPQQPVTPSPPEEKKGIPTKMIGIILGIIILIALAFLVIKMIPKEVEQAPVQEIVEVRPSISFSNNVFAFNEDTLLQRDGNIYDVGDNVYVWSVFKDFEQEQTPEGKYRIELSYGIEVSQPEYGAVYDKISNPNVAIIRKEFDSPIPDAYFTVRIPTTSLTEGFYTVKMKGTDRISGKSSEQQLSFELREPIQLKVVTLQLGEFEPLESVFTPKAIPYNPGDILQAYFEIRGFDVADNAPDVIVDLYITDEKGMILHDVSKTAVYVDNKTYLTKPVVMMVNLNVP